MKKTLAFLMSVALLAGCSGTADTPADETPAEDETAAETTEEETAEE